MYAQFLLAMELTIYSKLARELWQENRDQSHKVLLWEFPSVMVFCTTLFKKPFIRCIIDIYMTRQGTNDYSKGRKFCTISLLAPLLFEFLFDQNRID